MSAVVLVISSSFQELNVLTQLYIISLPLIYMEHPSIVKVEFDVAHHGNGQCVSSDVQQSLSTSRLASVKALVPIRLFNTVGRVT